MVKNDVFEEMTMACASGMSEKLLEVANRGGI
jgi:hypothetical protein